MPLRRRRMLPSKRLRVSLTPVSAFSSVSIPVVDTLAIFSLGHYVLRNVGTGPHLSRWKQVHGFGCVTCDHEHEGVIVELSDPKDPSRNEVYRWVQNVVSGDVSTSEMAD